MTGIDILERHAEELREATGLTVDLIEDGNRVFVLLHQVPLPPGHFRLTSTDVLFIADKQYPHSAIDMFWVELGVLRPDGSVPPGADSIEPYMNRSWRRFSWHRNGVWDPTRNGLLDHYAFMESRWVAEVRG